MNGPLLLSADGFLAGGTGLEIGFGRAPEGAIAAISDLTGTLPIAADQACGEPDSRVVLFPDGLSVTFRERMFAGWDFAGPSRAFATRKGLTTGIAPDTIVGVTVGTSTSRTFTVGRISGQVGTDGMVARLWAGAPCPAP